MLDWIKNHFDKLHELQLNSVVTDNNNTKIGIDEGFKSSIKIIKSIQQHHAKVIFIGNGGSAGIASHLAIDFSKNGGLPAMAFSDASALTCLSNDYGYEYVFSKQIEFHARKGDVVVVISSSGRSKNILNAVAAARAVGCDVITFSGFSLDNPLAKLGNVNFYIDSGEYGFVEVAHIALGHAILDNIIEQQAELDQRDTVLEAVN